MDNLRAALEAALFETPDDRATQAAYADYLAEQGDPHGEFISVQLALEDEARSPEERQSLLGREADLLAEHERDWLGELAPDLLDQSSEVSYRQNEFSLTRGWLDYLFLLELTSTRASALARCPLARRLCTLIIQAANFADPGYQELIRSAVLGNVRTFQLGEEERGRAPGEGLVPVIARMTRLEHLTLYAHSLDSDALFALPMPHLRSLGVHSLTHYPLAVLAANPSLGRLEELSIWPRCLHDPDDAAYLNAEAVSALVRSPHLTGLRRLHLDVSDMGDAGVDAIVESGFLKRLKVLSLWSGCITDAGARRLAACPDLRNLERLDIQMNHLTANGIQALVATGIKVVGEADDQFSDDEIAEREHLLWPGDME
jgi:uncharacterized protein (TIGR02996 family)